MLRHEYDLWQRQLAKRLQDATLLAGSAIGGYSMSIIILKIPQSGTYAVVAVPKMPNLTALLFFSGVGGTKDVYTRVNRDIMLLFIVFE